MVFRSFPQRIIRNHPETDSAGHPDVLRKRILQVIRMSSGNGFCRSSGYPPEHKERPVRSHRSLDAGGGARTHTPFLTTDFESVSSANSDTPAQEPLTAAPYRLYHLICFLSNRRRALCFFSSVFFLSFPSACQADDIDRSSGSETDSDRPEYTGLPSLLCIIMCNTRCSSYHILWSRPATSILACCRDFCRCSVT